jgi:nitronate monooxygenase
MSAFDLRDLTVPIIVAPMAGGPSTPELAAAGSEAGGLGFVPAGYLTAEVFAERITKARRLTAGPVGANLFAPQPSAGTPAAIEAYAKALATEELRYGATLGSPRFDDDAWAAKIEVLLDLRPDVASFTFGVPSADECRRLRDAGITTVGTVTTVSEAQVAVAAGVDVLAAQGPSAGGHRGTFDPSAQPASEPLDQLLTALKHDADIPVIAAGGLSTADDIRQVVDAGAVAAALTDPQFTETVVTRSFSGRYARGLRNRFIDEHEPEAPFGYPEVHYLTSPVRAAAVRAGDPHGVNVWAGTGFRELKAGSVAEIFAVLT